jgi:hypothetical protein
VTPVAPDPDADTVQIGLVMLPPVIETAPLVPVSTGSVAVLVATCDV